MPPGLRLTKTLSCDGRNHYKASKVCRQRECTLSNQSGGKKKHGKLPLHNTHLFYSVVSVGFSKVPSLHYNLLPWIVRDKIWPLQTCWSDDNTVVTCRSTSPHMDWGNIHLQEREASAEILCTKNSSYTCSITNLSFIVLYLKFLITILFKYK